MKSNNIRIEQKNAHKHASTFQKRKTGGRHLKSKEFYQGYRSEKGLDGFAVNHGIACKHYERAAERGDPQAQYKLAYYNEKGLNGPVSITTAVILYKEAAKKGNSDAICRIAYFYSEGLHGFKQDSVRARELCEKLALRKHAAGTSALARFHEKGLGGFPQSQTAATALYKEAARLGNPQAQKWVKDHTS